MSGFVHGGNFEQAVNRLCSIENIERTAKKFVELEAQQGDYTFGKFLKSFMPKPDEWADRSGSPQGFEKWERDSAALPQDIRERLASILATNLRSPAPLPIVFKVTDGVDSGNELSIRLFVHKERMHMGILLLCPNPALK